MNRKEGQEQEAQSHRESVRRISIYPDMSIHLIFNIDILKSNESNSETLFYSPF